MMSVIERTPEIDGLSTAGTVPTSPATGSIQLNDVMFSYPSRPNINTCNKFCLSINSGETVALVGQSGCGKSTIINLLLRFYDPQAGEILLDGHRLSDLNLRWLRAVCGYVGTTLNTIHTNTIHTNTIHTSTNTIHTSTNTIHTNTNTNTNHTNTNTIDTNTIDTNAIHI